MSMCSSYMIVSLLVTIACKLKAMELSSEDIEPLLHWRTQTTNLDSIYLPTAPNPPSDNPTGDSTVPCDPQTKSQHFGTGNAPQDFLEQESDDPQFSKSSSTSIAPVSFFEPASWRKHQGFQKEKSSTGLSDLKLPRVPSGSTVTTGTTPLPMNANQVAYDFSHIHHEPDVLGSVL
ncbi:hypothetical protein PGT21_035739 [Puccinia graminis f. sp. tritici]|uniref:Uncharacterized protein n=1 Tax=Puccinia graminis f. sp. tritici TaxID=56615 RepID=A0A5B0Q018_PUCGR|nr:hypothetical protein PGT21_035739 [Puccinia graminis f. sp. tritici]KAA1126300.1 hypothetical protein PGTUg99_024839 [Puccinia graminis f. sp. tritici]